VVRAQETETQRLENEIASLRQRLDVVERQQGTGTSELSALSQSLQQAKLQAGLVDLEGPGIVITMDDNREGALRAQAAKPGQYQPEDFIIHDKNVLYLVNELKLAGAEAIAVNNQQLVTGSDIRCVGTAILVNATRLVPPYEIKALGDPDALATAITNCQEYPFLKGKGFPVTLEKKTKLPMPAYRGSLLIDHLQTFTGQTGEAAPPATATTESGGSQGAVKD
jgi:uncharacterized protein YlxW (UPF0749 family)